MVTGISILLFSVFLLLSIFHMYWSLGGRWGKDDAVPARSDNRKVFVPGRLLTFIIALGLLATGFFLLLAAGFWYLPVAPSFYKRGIWMIAVIFLARAVGDFKYTGFFKTVTATRFGKKDTKYYTPLSFMIGLLAIVLAIL